MPGLQDRQVREFAPGRAPLASRSLAWADAVPVRFVMPRAGRDVAHPRARAHPGHGTWPGWVGQEMTTFLPGDEVFSTAKGALAEHACAPESKLTPKQANLTFEQTAVVAVPGQTALQSLRDHGRAQPGQKVLITGASGGVETLAAQLAKTFGAQITGVCNTIKEDLVRFIGGADACQKDRRHRQGASESTSATITSGRPDGPDMQGQPRRPTARGPTRSADRRAVITGHRVAGSAASPGSVHCAGMGATGESCSGGRLAAVLRAETRGLYVDGPGVARTGLRLVDLR